MRWLECDTFNCSVQRALDVVGDRWSLLILREAFHGVRRFDDMATHLRISESVLTRRLRGLMEADVLTRVAYRGPGARTRYEYRLTERGMELFPVITALMQWGDRHLVDEPTSAWSVTHKTCGEPVEVVVRCVHDHEVLDPYQTRTEPGPAARRLPTSTEAG